MTESNSGEDSGPAVLPKPTIVYNAVASQLRRERRWPPEDLGRVMSTHYRYDEITLETFLRGVARTLRNNAPPLVFNFDDNFVRTGLTQTVGALIASVNAASNWAG